MARMEPLNTIVLLTISVIVILHGGDGCFEDNLVLDPLSTWIQPLSLGNRLYYYVATSKPNQMKVESEPNIPKEYVKREYTCLEVYDGNRMMVQVQENDDDKPHFQCLKFETLSENVVRQSKTKLRALKKKVDCDKEKYYADEAVLAAMDLLKSHPCPLQGGYQMLLHEGEIIRGHCMDSVKSYNPNLQFQCDKFNVIADFGRDCEPPILAQSQKMRRRHIAHLSCVGSWKEKGNINSLLLRMRDQPYTLWCIHYKQSNTSNELISIFMTLDGRCVKDAFHNEDSPKKSSLFGNLASYVPSDDIRCSESEYLDQCYYDEALCYDSDECPANCKRCNKRPSPSSCGFMLDTIGHWKTVDSRPEMTVDIIEKSLRVSQYGEFSCRGEADRNLPGRVYPVVQSDESSSCLPYYACAQVVSPALGILYFNLRPAWRDEDTGEPFTCKQTDDKIGDVVPVEDERTFTMIDFEKLKKSSCGFHKAEKFPTLLESCLLEVGECDGNCTMLVAKYDNETCGTQSVLGFPIETNHDCYAKFIFTDGIRGMLTYSKFSDRYFCWIYSSSHLFIAPPANCNSERVDNIIADSQATVSYDPLNALSKPIYGSSKEKNDNNNNFEQLRYNRLVVFLFCLIPVFNHLFKNL